MVNFCADSIKVDGREEKGRRKISELRQATIKADLERSTLKKKALPCSEETGKIEDFGIGRGKTFQR